MVKRIKKPSAIYYVGNARQIRKLYQHLKKDSAYIALFTDDPQFNYEKIYGLEIDLERGNFFVIGETSVCYLLMGEVA